MKRIIIKTEKEIGKFINNSYIDNIPLREVNVDDLKDLSLDEYQIINMENPKSLDEILNNKENLMKDFFNEKK